MPDTNKLVLTLVIDWHMLTHGANRGGSYYYDQILPLHIRWESYEKVILSFPDLDASIIDNYFLTDFIMALCSRISPKMMSEKIEFALYPDISNGFRQPDKSTMANQVQDLNNRFQKCLATVVGRLK